MKSLTSFVAFLVLVGFSGTAPADTHTFRIAQAKPAEACSQVISCGTKDGKRKEYPTPCAAHDDGATDVKPKSGPTCETAIK